MKVLLAIDSSTASQHVVDRAATRPWPSGTAFCVMSVVDVGRLERPPILVEETIHEAQSLVKSATAKLTQTGHKVFSEVHLGFPRKAIPEYAKEWSADLVMVGSHGQSAVTRFLLGSVAQAVLRTSPCSVEIVRSGLHPSHGIKVLLATDGSECSAKAVHSVAKSPWPKGTQIKLLSVVQLLIPEIPSVASPLCSPYPSSLLDQVWKEARTRAEEAVADARKTLSATGLNICDCNATPMGEPRAFILDEAKAWGADLIVLGSHGRHGLDRLLMGSVSESVALYAHCSVEVVRQ
jgi:nucleotide-binding universal stress UspA family protein